MRISCKFELRAGSRGSVLSQCTDEICLFMHSGIKKFRYHIYHVSFRNSSECSILNLFYYCLLRKCNCLSKMVSRTKLCVSARRFLHAQRQSRAKRNSSKRRTCNAVALRTLDMPKETYPYIHSGCRFSTFHPATGKSASLSDVGKFAASSGACPSGPQTEAITKSTLRRIR